MKSYLNYITEGATEGQTTLLSDNEMFDLIKSNCKNFSFEDNSIFRSINLEKDNYQIDPDIAFGPRNYEHEGKLYRKSAYANNNHYTMLINHLKSWSEFPKRQVICGNYDKGYYKLYRIIPFDNTKIGMVPCHDIQDSYRDCEFWKIYNMYFMELNMYYDSFNVPSDNWENFTVGGYKDKFSLQNIYENYEKYHVPERYKELFNLDALPDIVSPKNMACKLLEYSDYKNMDFDISHWGHMNEHELWIDKKHLLIRNNSVPLFRKKFNI